MTKSIMLYRKKKNKKDVKYILDHLREYDRIECQATHGENWKEKILQDIMNSDSDILLGINSQTNKAVCMGGVWHTSDNEKGIGTVWMYSTDDVKNHAITLLRNLKKEFEKYDQKFWLTYNFMYSKNEQARMWLKWLGFDFSMAHSFRLRKIIPKGFEFFYRIRTPKGLDI